MTAGARSAHGCETAFPGSMTLRDGKPGHKLEICIYQPESLVISSSYSGSVFVRLTRWSAMPGNAYAAISRGKQIQLSYISLTPPIQFPG